MAHLDSALACFNMFEVRASTDPDGENVDAGATPGGCRDHPADE